MIILTCKHAPELNHAETRGDDEEAGGEAERLSESDFAGRNEKQQVSGFVVLASFFHDKQVTSFSLYSPADPVQSLSWFASEGDEGTERHPYDQSKGHVDEVVGDKGVVQCLIGRHSGDELRVAFDNGKNGQPPAKYGPQVRTV